MSSKVLGCHRYFALLWLITNFSVSHISWAQIQTKKETVDIAHRKMFEAIALIKEKKFAEAASRLDESYRTFPANDTLHLLGRLYDKQPHECLRSIATWQLLVQQCDEGCDIRTDSLVKLKEAELACQGELIIQTVPKNAHLYLNHQQVSKITPFKKRVTARTYNLMVIQEGYESVERQIIIERGWKKEKIFVELQSTKLSRGSKQLSKVVVRSSNKKVSLRLPSKPAQPSHDIDQNSDESQQLLKMLEQRLPKNYDPFTRLKSPHPIKQGKMSMSGDRSIVAQMNCEYLTRVQKYLSLKKCDGVMVKALDRFYLSLLPQQDSYAYVVSNNDKGQWQLIFPTEGEENLLKSNILKSIPEKEWLLFDNATNTIEKIFVIASPQKIPIFEQQRGRTLSQSLPAEVSSFFIPKSLLAHDTKVKSSRILQANTDMVLDHPQVLHTSFEVYR